MTFTADNLFPSHSCIGVTQVKPPWDSNLGLQDERRMTYQLSHHFPYMLKEVCVHVCDTNIMDMGEKWSSADAVPEKTEQEALSTVMYTIKSHYNV